MRLVLPFKANNSPQRGQDSLIKCLAEMDCGLVVLGGKCNYKTMCFKQIIGSHP